MEVCADVSMWAEKTFTQRRVCWKYFSTGHLLRELSGLQEMRWYHYITAKKSTCYFDNCIIMSPQLQLLTRIFPCGRQQWAIQHTWSTRTAEIGLEFCLGIRYVLYTTKGHWKDPCHVNCSTYTGFCRILATLYLNSELSNFLIWNVQSGETSI